MNLVDEDTFSQAAQFENILSANAPLTKARDCVLTKKLNREGFLSLLSEARKHPLLADNRQLRSLIASPPTDEDLNSPEMRSTIAHRLDSANILGHVVTRTRKREVTEWRVIREPVAEKIALTPPEAAFYNNVTHLIREFCAKYNRHEGFLLVTPQLQMCSSMPAALAEWQRRKQEYLDRLRDDENYDPENDDAYGPLVLEIINQVETLGHIDELRKVDSKFERLQAVLRKILKEKPSEKVIIFSRFRPTLEYLKARLDGIGFENILMMGGKEFDKDAIIKEFSRSNGPNVLLSSEVGSEGIDLQFCHILINYDLPWNPMRIEQRIGRIDRLGQRAPKISIWNLFYKDTIDGRVYTKLFERLRVFENALGGLEAVIGEEIDKLTYDLLSQQLTPKQEEERIEQAAFALENKRRMEEELEENASQLVAYGDYVLHQINATKELNRWIDARDIQIYITDFFGMHYPGCHFKQLDASKLEYEITLTNKAKHDLESFLKETRIPESTALVQNDPSPVRCRFENKLVLMKPIHAEVINQIHPLIRFVTQTIESNAECNYPAVSVRLNSKFLPIELPKGAYVFTVQRWHVRGLQDIEQLHFAVATMGSSDQIISASNAERLVLAATTNGTDWLEARNSIALGQTVELALSHCLPNSDQAYDDYITEMKNKNADRADVQEKTLDRHLDNQLAKLNEVLEKHRGLNRASLAKATEGKIEKLKNRVDRKKIEIRQRREVFHSKGLICAGIIDVV